MAQAGRNKLPRNTESNAQAFEFFYDLLKRYPPFFKEVERHYLMIIHGYTSLNPLLKDLGIRNIIKPTKKNRQEYRQRFITHNMRLVISRVKRRRAYNDPLTMPLISAGQLGLITAVDKFDIKKKTRFSTYATHWIEHYIKKEFEFAVRATYPALTKLGRSFSDAQNLLRLITDELVLKEAVFDYLAWSPAQILKYHSGGDKISNTDIAHMLDRNSFEHRPLSQVIPAAGDTDDGRPLFWLTQPLQPDDTLCKSDDDIKMQKALRKLSKREATVIALLFGVLNVPKINRKRLSSIMGISITTIKKVEQRALKKLFILLKE